MTNFLAPDRHDRTVARLTLVLLVLGILWRCVKYALATPVWGDEAMLGLNLLDRAYADLMKPLAYSQVAPLGFLAGELTAMRFLGLSEWAIRLFPFLCGLLALALFWQLARQLLNPLSTMIAVGTYAVGTYMARHAVEFKPYAGDQLATVAVLLPAVLWLKHGRTRWLLVLALVTAPAISLSFPVCFVVAGIGVALVLPVVQSRRASTIVAWLVFGLVAAAAFATVYFLSIRGQYDTTGASMRAYWKDSFPPANPLRFLWWLVDIHAGNMLAHPFGGKNFGSAGTLLICLAGLWSLWTVRRADPKNLLAPAVRTSWLLPLLLLPFAFTFFAAALQRYPYGGSARVAMHLAPAICILVGVGWAAMIAMFKDARLRGRATALVAGVLAIIALGGIAYDCLRSFKPLPDAQVRQVVRAALGQAPQVQVVSRAGVPVNFLWYLRASGREFEIVAADAVNPGTSTVVLCFARDDEQLVQARLAALGLRCRTRTEGEYQIGPIQMGPTWCSVTVWEPRAPS